MKPHRPMPRIAFVAHFVICLAINSLSHARAEDGMINVPCGPVSEMKDAGKYRRLSHDEWMAMRVAFFLAPTTPAALPPGDSALVLERSDGSATVVFIDGDEACAPMHILKDGLSLLKQIGSGVVTHPSGRM